jgi:hypothetical protein
LTLDEDVALRLKKAAEGRAFKDVANRALRLGLQAMEVRETQAKYVTKPVSGKPTVENLDNIAEILAEREREDWR